MSRKNKGGGAQKSRVLSDHKKVGKRFVPPWLQAMSLHEIKWADCILPELLWLGLLNDCYGLAKGADLSLSLARAAIMASAPPSKTWFAPTSAYAALTEEQGNAVIRSLKLSHDLEPVKEALTPLAAFYPKCPLNLLFEGTFPSLGDSRKTLEQFKEFLSTLFNRWGKTATLMQANAVYIAFATDLLKVAKDLALANFPAVAEFPDTEESIRVAASVRATINGFFGDHFYDKSSPWPRYFWNRGLELEPCDYQGIHEAYE
jgi:hypothetical protein